MCIFHLNTADFSQLPSTAQRALCQLLARLESQILAADAWGDEMIAESLKQFGAGVLLDVITDKDAELITALENLSAANVRGYCIYQCVFETAEIHRIGTSPDFLRQGVASRLIDALNTICQAEGAEQVLLEVRADNLAAISLYQRVGFGQIDKRLGYYKTDSGVVDALILQLDL